MKGGEDLARLLFSSQAARRPCETIGDWLRVWHGEQASCADNGPFVAAVASARAADRMAWAFFCGYQGAIQSGFGAGSGQPGTFCANESGRRIHEIETTLDVQGETLTLSGHKSWALAGFHELDLYVLARRCGGPSKGPGSLVVVRVPADAPGVQREASHPLDFIPELPHGPIRFDSVAVKPADVLAGDGYADHAKPFRLREDLFIRACVLAWLLSEADAGEWPSTWKERAVAAAWSLGELCELDLREADTVLLAAGALSFSDEVLREAEPHWTGAQRVVQDRWQRDARLLTLGQDARRQRAARAWQTVD